MGPQRGIELGGVRTPLCGAAWPTRLDQLSRPFLSFPTSVVSVSKKLIAPSPPVGHMPFGKVDALRDQSNYANQIFQRYASTIAAHFYGHRHVRAA